MSFYEVVANLIPVLLIALAVERFAASPDPHERPRQFTTGLGAIAALTVAEAFTLAVVARGTSTQTIDYIVISALGFGWLLLVVALANTMFLEFPSEERGTARRKPLNLLILAVAVLCPMTFVLAYAVAIVS